MAKVYDPKLVTILIDGTYLTGLGEDMVEVEQDEEGMSVKVGAQGDVIRTKVHNHLGTLKITLQSTSPQIPMLNQLANSGKLFSVSVIYAGEPKETSTATQAFIKKPATRSYGNEAEDREFEIQALDLKLE